MIIERSRAGFGWSWGMLSILLAQSACAPAGGVVALQPATGCTITEIAREPLRLTEGGELYVEPAVLAPSRDGELLLLGRYNYLFQPVADRWMPAAADSVMGAVIDRSGAAWIVNAPFPANLLDGIRALDREDGGWDVVFAQLRPSADTLRSDTVDTLWYGVLRKGGWAMLERLPASPGSVVHGDRFSSLVRWGDTLAWAVGQQVANEPLMSVLVYERGGSEWSSSVIPAPPAYVELMHHPAMGLAVAVVQPDPMQLRDANSLLLWTRQPDWRIHGRIVRGRDGLVHAPSVRMRGDEGVLSWKADVPAADGGYRHESYAMVGRIATRNEPVLGLDSLTIPLRPLHFLDFSAARRMWLVEHGAPDAERSELRFVREAAGRAVLVSSMSSPYVTPVVAAAVSPSEAVVSGGVIAHEGDAVVTLLLRMRMECLEAR